MRKFLPVIFSGLAAISFSQLTMAGAYGDKDSSAGASSSADTRSGAGPTDNPNVTRDAQGREHVNKGKHTGQVKNKKESTTDRDDRYSSKREEDRQSSGSGSTSAPKKDDSLNSDRSSGANSSATSPSIGADVGASGSARTEVK